MSCGIYKYENKINHKIYIGQTVDFEKRYQKHLKNINDFNKQEVFYKALRKYGIDNFDYEQIVILNDYDKELLNELEIYYIQYYNSLIPNGYNMNSGGSNGAGISKGKKVIQYDLDGNYIKTFNSCSEASRETGINSSSISSCARGEITHTKFFQWKYYNSDKIITSLKNVKIIDRVINQYDLNYNLVNTYKNLNTACQETKIEKTLISLCCTGKMVSTHNYIFRYSDNIFKRDYAYNNKEARHILQFDKNNTFIKEWNKACDITEELHINLGNIYSVCNGKRTTAGGFIWKYKE